jgi:uncharacterized protein YoxC
MVIIGLAAVVMAITLVVLAAFIIPAIIEIRRSATALREFLDKTDDELQGALKELRETLANLKEVTGEVAGRSSDITSFMEAIGDTGRNLHTINNVVGSVTGAVGRSSLWLTGAKVAGKYVIERLSKKRG